MKILQVNKMYSPDIGGVETVCQQYSECYSKQHDVTVLCVNKNFKFFGTTTYINNVKVIRCSSLGTFFSMPVSFSFIFNFFFQFLKCDVAFIHLPFPLADLSLFISYFIKRKVYLVWHSDIVKQGFLKKLLFPLLNWTVHAADQIIVTSPKMLEHSSSLRGVVDKVLIIPLSIDSIKIRGISSLNAEDLFSELNLSHVSKPLDGLFFGRLCYYKGVYVLLNMLLLAKKSGLNCKVLIAGCGEYSSVVESFIKKHELSNVFFVNRFLSDAEKYYLISKSKCFLFPSVEVSEAFGITQLEAMCLGVPVINTNLASGVPWVSLDHVTGLTVEPNNAKQFLHAFSLLLSNDCMLKKFSVNAVDRVNSEFDDSVVFNKLNLLIKE
ncbi:glycosyltransferase [Shewanella baltica]|uniref:glycosyltransferase n=1 Tax=Shewanella baltica TaxID=62322 RepID=UPI003D7A0321